MRSTQLLLLALAKWQLGFCSCCILSSKICPNCTCTQLFSALTASLAFVAQEDFVSVPGLQQMASGSSLSQSQDSNPPLSCTIPFLAHALNHCSCILHYFTLSVVWMWGSNDPFLIKQASDSLILELFVAFYDAFYLKADCFPLASIQMPWKPPFFYNKSFEHLSIQLSLLRMISFMGAYLLCCIYGYWIVFHSWGEMACLTRSSLVGIYEF